LRSVSFCTVLINIFIDEFAFSAKNIVLAGIKVCTLYTHCPPMFIANLFSSL
jgi:hypothetical protein